MREYTERYYLPAAAAYRKRLANKGALGAQILAWRRDLAARWPDARFGTVRTEMRDDQYHITVEVHLGGLDPEGVSVELFADPLDGEEPIRQGMARGRRLEGPGHGYEYVASVPASRNATDYTPCLVPQHQEARVPLEASEILWQR